MTGFKLGISGDEATTLPSDPQQLPPDFFRFNMILGMN